MNNKKIEIYCVNTGSNMECEPGTSLSEVVKMFDVEMEHPIVGALVNNCVRELSYTVYKPKVVEFFDVNSSNGQRMYRRSLSFIMAKAVHDVAPELNVTVEPDEYEDFVKDCANLYIDYGISDKAYEWMMRSKGDDSDDFKELMARTLFGLGKYKDSERLFNELIDRNPYSKQYWNALASVQFMREDYSNSITSSEYAIAIDPQDPEGILSKANGLYRLNNYEEALKWYQRYEELIPDDEFGVLHQGICLLNMERNDEALEKLEASIAIAPDDSPFRVQIYQELAFCYSAKKMLEEALQMLDKTETLDCDHIDNMVLRGHFLLENGHIDRAEKAFKKAILESDYAPHVVLRIIVSLYDNHYIQACYEMLKKFLDYANTYAPEFKSGYAHMALCCYDLGRKDEFLEYLKKAVEATPSETRIVLSCLFPPEIKVSDYYEYMKEKLNN